MPHISELTPEPGERHAIFGGTRAGKSAFQQMSFQTVQLERPDAMQILVDTKPRFRAETEKGLRPKWRRDTAYRYSSWSKGPVVPNSVVVDLWSDRPFAGTFEKPGEIVILQSGEGTDWRRILQLLDGFVKANLKGRERRLIVDECLDFTSATPGASTQRTTFFIVRPEQEESGISELILAHIASMVFLHSFFTCSLGSRYSTCVRIRICDTSRISDFRTPYRRREITYSVNTGFSLAEQYHILSREHSIFQIHIYPNSQQHKKGGEP